MHNRLFKRITYLLKYSKTIKQKKCKISLHISKKCKISLHISPVLYQIDTLFLFLSWLIDLVLCKYYIKIRSFFDSKRYSFTCLLYRPNSPRELKRLNYV